MRCGSDQTGARAHGRCRPPLACTRPTHAWPVLFCSVVSCRPLNQIEHERPRTDRQTINGLCFSLLYSLVLLLLLSRPTRSFQISPDVIIYHLAQNVSIYLSGSALCSTLNFFSGELPNGLSSSNFYFLMYFNLRTVIYLRIQSNLFIYSDLSESAVHKVIFAVIYHMTHVINILKLMIITSV